MKNLAILGMIIFGSIAQSALAGFCPDSPPRNPYDGSFQNLSGTYKAIVGAGGGNSPQQVSLMEYDDYYASSITATFHDGYLYNEPAVAMGKRYLITISAKNATTGCYLSVTIVEETNPVEVEPGGRELQPMTACAFGNIPSGDALALVQRDKLGNSFGDARTVLEGQVEPMINLAASGVDTFNLSFDSVITRSYQIQVNPDSGAANCYGRYSP